MDRDIIISSAALKQANEPSKKKIKKFKKVNLLKNPFSDSNNAIHHRTPLDAQTGSLFNLHNNPFSDSRAFLNKYNDNNDDDDDDDDDEEEDEERMVQARRDALISLDPKNKASRTAEFKSLKVSTTASTKLFYSTATSSSNNISNNDGNNEKYEYLDLEDHVPEHSPSSMYDSSLEDVEDLQNQSRQHQQEPVVSYTASTPTSSEFPEDTSVVPEIAVRLATPSPKSHHRRGSSVSTCPKDPSLLSSNYTPSQLSTTLSPDPLDEEWGLSVAGQPKAKSNRTTALYKNFFQRITSPAISKDVVNNKADEDIQDFIGAEIDKDPGMVVPNSSAWSIKRGTFGAPTAQGNRQQRNRDSFSNKQKTRQFGRNSWDSDVEMLIQDPDKTDDGYVPDYIGQVAQSLKGQVGGGRTNEDNDDSVLERGQTSRLGSILNRGFDQGWMVHPRTAAIYGTFHNDKEETVPVPAKAARPMSLQAGYTTISLDSPPGQERKGASLTRGGSLDSSFYRMKKKNTSTMFMGLGSVPVYEGNTKGEEMEEYGKLGSRRDSCISDSSSDGSEDWISNYRSSSATFGMHMAPSSPPRGSFNRFSSFRDIINSATSLGRSSSAPGNSSPPPFMNSNSNNNHSKAHVRRSQTIAFTGHQEFQKDFSKHQKNIAAMVPTIVVPQDLPYKRKSLSATTVTFNPSSASSSITIIPGSDGLYQNDNDDVEFDEYGTTQFQSRGLNNYQKGYLRVPEPARTTPAKPNNALAMSAMVAASRALGRGIESTSSDSLMGSLTSEDYIGQFERERAQARQKGGTWSSSSLATTVQNGGNSFESFERSAKVIDMTQLESGEFEKEHRKKVGSNNNNAKKSSFWNKVPLIKYFRNRNGGGSEQSDISEKLMDLPEPSRFEGICSCRGFINITSMLLILCGLLLLVLGYPILSGLKRERIEAEAEAARNAMVVNGADISSGNVTGNITVFGGERGMMSNDSTIVRYKVENGTLLSNVSSSNDNNNKTVALASTTATVIKI